MYDFEKLLPQSLPEMVESFIDSEYLEEEFNDVIDCYTSGENGDWCVEQILDGYEPADDPAIYIIENYNYIAQNEDFKKLCEEYYNDEFDIEEDGTFKDNYIDADGNFDFEKFLENTDFEYDVLYYNLDQAILKDSKIYDRMDEIRQSYKEDEKAYYDSKYQDYTAEELNEEMDKLYEAPIYANGFHDEEIQRKIYSLNMDAMERALEKIQEKNTDDIER